MAERSDYLVKGVLLVILGIIIAFFPKIISGIFCVIGLIIIIGSVKTLFTSAGQGAPMIGGSIIGMLIGAFIAALPKFLMIRISLLAGTIFAILGITRLIGTIKKRSEGRSRIISIAWAVVLILGGIFFMINPLRLGNAIRFAIGLILTGFGVFDFIVAKFIKQRYSGSTSSSSGIVDVDTFSVHDGK
ncbi:MAG: DUF308 domain-containing protein [Ruminococcus sp.]|nr:DUF308 domain-containing protein [Ruminococcus sp.]